MNDGERYERGLQRYIEIQGETATDELEEMRKVSDDLARYVTEFAFGDVLSRTELDLRTRELVTVGVLIATNADSEILEGHISAALRVGCTREEIVEVIIQMLVYAGAPRALQAAKVAARVFERT
jgi:4-carboxymuconolactone decarboxylase